MEEGNQHFRYQRSCDIEAVIVSMFALLTLHNVHLNKLKKDSSTILFFYFIFNTTNNDNNNNIILELIKYPVPYSFLILVHMRLQHVIVTTRKYVFILHMSGQEVVCIGIGSNNKV